MYTFAIWPTIVKGYINTMTMICFEELEKKQSSAASIWKFWNNNIYSAIAIERDLDNIKNAFELLIWTVIFKWMPLATWIEYGKATIVTIL